MEFLQSKKKGKNGEKTKGNTIDTADEKVKNNLFLTIIEWTGVATSIAGYILVVPGANPFGWALIGVGILMSIITYLIKDNNEAVIPSLLSISAGETAILVPPLAALLLPLLGANPIINFLLILGYFIFFYLVGFGLGYIEDMLLEALHNKVNK